MSNLKPKLELNEESLMMLMNYILGNLSEERELALKNYDSISGIVDGPLSEGMNDLNQSMLLNDLSESITKFLTTAQKSTAEMIKVAKTISDMLIKVSNQDPFSDEQRDELSSILANSENLLSSLEEEMSELKEDS